MLSAELQASQATNKNAATFLTGRVRVDEVDVSHICDRVF